MKSPGLRRIAMQHSPKDRLNIIDTVPLIAHLSGDYPLLTESDQNGSSISHSYHHPTTVFAAYTP